MLNFSAIDSKKSEGELKKSILGVDVFKSEPWLLPYVKSAIDKMEVPWGCSPELTLKIKAAAFEAVMHGWATHPILNELVPTLFKTKKDAKWAFSSLTICGMSAITYARFKSLRVKKFKWIYLNIPNLCIYPEHSKWGGRLFNFDEKERPASRYLCRCMAQLD
jgi:hypothetical protein